MSITASLDVKLSTRESNDFSIIKLIELLLKKNWSLNDNEKITFLPLGDDGDYNWCSQVLDEATVIEIISKKIHNKETVGLVLIHNEDSRGVQLLWFGDNEVSFNLSINPKYRIMEGKTKIIDSDWYIETLVNTIVSEYNIDALSIEQLGS